MTRVQTGLLTILTCALLAVGAAAQQGPTVQYPPLLSRDEGVDLGRLTRAIDFTGAWIDCAWASGVTTCDVPARASTDLTDTANLARLNAANVFSLINPLTTATESWVGPTSTTGVYFKGGNVGIGTITPGSPLSVVSALTTGITVDIADTAVTTGRVLSVTGASGAGQSADDLVPAGIIYITGNLASVSSGTPAVAGLYSDIVINPSAAFSTNANAFFATSVQNTVNAAMNWGTYSDLTDSTNLANFNIAVDGQVTMSGAAAKNSTGVAGNANDTTTTASTSFGGDFHAIAGGAVAAGTQLVHGIRASATSSVLNGATSNTYGGHFTGDGTVTAGTINSYGVYIANGTATTNGTSTHVGLHVEAITGADTNYAAIFAGGNVGIGIAAPVAPLHAHLVGDGPAARFSATGEVSATIHADTGGTSADTDAFLRFVIDGGAGTLKGLVGYDQGLDKFVMGYDGGNRIAVDSTGRLGVGTTSPSRMLHVSRATLNQFIASQSTPPTCTSSCGTGSSITGSDTFMTLTMGSSGSPASGFVITFSGAWPAAPSCVGAMATAGMVVGKLPLTIVTTATTMTVVTNGTNPSTNNKYHFHCGGPTG